MARPRTIEFNGQKYRLSGRYYRRNVWGSPGPSNLHRAVWESVHGAIPDGCHIHHINGDPFDNRVENLECIDGRQHASEHAKHPNSWNNSAECREHLAGIRPKAARWHGSPAGVEWHREHGKRTWENRASAPAVCESCSSEYETLTPHKARFCSKACKAKHRRDSGVDNEVRKCVSCDTPFTVNRYAEKRTCSRPCADALRKAGRVRSDD